MNKTIEMRINTKGFDAIVAGTKLWEICVNDEKRSAVRIGDEIIFFRRPECTESVKTIVEEREVFQNLQRMLDKIPLKDINDSQTELEYLQSFMAHYRPEEMVNCGIVALKIKKI